MARQAREEMIAGIDALLREFGHYLRPQAPPPGQEMNVTMGQMHCLGTIAGLGNPTMSQVAEEMGLHPSTVTVLVDGLVAHGLVRRQADPADRRVVRVSETAKGRKNHERHMAEARAHATRMLGDLDNEQLAQVEASLRILRDAAVRYHERLRREQP